MINCKFLDREGLCTHPDVPDTYDEREKTCLVEQGITVRCYFREPEDEVYNSRG